MAEVVNKQPRAFKFVGGPSRKRKPNSTPFHQNRRRRNLNNEKPAQNSNHEVSNSGMSEARFLANNDKSESPMPENTENRPDANPESLAEPENDGQIEMSEPPELDGTDSAPLHSSLQLNGRESPFRWPEEPTTNGGLMWGDNVPFPVYEFDPVEFSSLLTPFLETLDNMVGLEDSTTATPSDTSSSSAQNSDLGDQPHFDGCLSPKDFGIVSLMGFSNSPQVPPPKAITGAMDNVLLQYDQEFCVLPLTSDFDANPFRCSVVKSRESKLLLHSILALSYRHINQATGQCGKEAHEHKMLAMRMLEENQSAESVSTVENGVLEAILVLFTLNCSVSAYGPWTSQLALAHRVLRTLERSCKKRTPQVQAQVSMLLWWDVTLSLTTRKGHVLPEVYLDNYQWQDAGTEETFYNVSGCPEDLFRHMRRLGQYAREFELVMTMTCVTFDKGPVLAVEEDIRNWEALGYSDCIKDTGTSTQDPPSAGKRDLEELLDYRQDLHHCAEAWRYALLLYIERVFKWDRKEKASPVLGILARKTLNHVSCCRRSTMLQKQLLLPVFLAGCETSNHELRQQARHYCKWWNERTRYDMFLTAAALLEEVWVKTGPGDWWGSIMDEKCLQGARGHAQNQYLLG